MVCSHQPSLDQHYFHTHHSIHLQAGQPSFSTADSQAKVLFGRRGASTTLFGTHPQQSHPKATALSDVVARFLLLPDFRRK